MIPSTRCVLEDGGDDVPVHDLALLASGVWEAERDADVDFALAGARLDGQDETPGIVEQCVDADRDEPRFELQRHGSGKHR